MTLAPPKFELVLNIPESAGLTAEAHRNRTLLEDAYRKMVAGDTEALARLLHPDVVFREAAGLPYGVEAKGIEGALAGVAGMFSAWSSVHVEFFEFLAGGDMVIAYMMMTAVGQATGKTYKGPTAEMFRFRDGLIVEWAPIYWDTHAVRVACGLA